MAIYDVTIIGGGPVGLFGATMGGLHGMSVKVIESLPELGGQLYALYPEKPIYDVAGFPGVPAKELVGHLVTQAMRYHPTICLEESVLSLAATPEGPYRLTTNKGEHLTRTVLITVGIGAFTPRKLPAAGAEAWAHKGLYYFVPSMIEFSRKRVVVVGGGDTAVDWTLALAPYAESVALVHRRAEFRAQESSLREVHESPNVTVKTMCEITAINGTEAIESVTLTSSETGLTEELPADAVVSGLGFQPNLGPVKTWGIQLQGNAIAVSLDSMQTNLPGVYAAGDVAAYPGKVKLIATGFGEIGIAVAQIRSYLDPTKKGLPHSTNIKTARDPAAQG